MTMTGNTPPAGRQTLWAKLMTRRITVHPLVLMAGTAIFIMAVDNNTFWQKGFALFPDHPGQLAVLGIAVFSLFLAVMSPFGGHRLVRPGMAFFLILSAVSSYYVDKLGVVVDREMIRNVVTTTYTESKHLVTLSFVLHVLIWGVLPSLVVFWFRVRPVRWWKGLLTNVAIFVIGFSLSAGLLMTNLKSYASVFRENKDFMGSFQPGAPLVGTIRYVKQTVEARDIVVAEIGTDARKGPALAGAPKPVLTIVVVGETARSQNFSMNGYERETNRYTSKLPVISYSDVSSCGTATAVSMPCMFSIYDRSEYTYNKGISTENVLDVLDNAGVDVKWWDNNTGDKAVADRVEFLSVYGNDEPEFCSSGECEDAIFLPRIKALAESITEDTLLVVHLIGSHGPTYYLRYPPEFEEYTPACRTADFQYCTQQEVLNAYDNSILYTDYVLSRMIGYLSGQEKVTSALLYISDHGESMGEGGLYLHGTPYMFAPETQTKVPMQLWMSQSFRDLFGFNWDCLGAQKDAPLSHANLFHSILGLMDIETEVRQDNLDIFSKCKTQGRTTASRTKPKNHL